METEKPTEKPKKKQKRNRKKDYPGTIYKPASCQTLYVKVLRQRVSTGLPANAPESMAIAKEIAWRLYKGKKGITGNVAPVAEPIPTVLQAFAKYESIALKKRKPNTVRNYTWAYQVIFADKNQPFTVSNLKKAVQSYVDTSELTAESIATAVRNLSPFVSFAQQRGLLRSDNNESLAESPKISLQQYKPRVPKKDIVPFEPEEIAALVTYWETRDAEFSRLLRLLYATGFRISEALTLEWGQIEKTVIRLSNKITSDIEYFPRTDEVDEILTLQDHDRVRVFRWNSNSTNESRLYKWLRESLEALDIPRREEKSFHSIRKAFAMRLWDSGLNNAEVSSLMRHQDIDITMKLYTKYSKTALGKTLNAVANNKSSKIP